MTLTETLKMECWKRFGSAAYPAEWDGNTLGGGKLSQRYWEYFKAIELLALTSTSTVLDIGGGSPVTGAGFLMGLIAGHVQKITIMDPNLAGDAVGRNGMDFVRQLATYESLSALLKSFAFSHISLISVLEHIEQNSRTEIMRAINDHFTGDTLVLTLEYHDTQCFFEHQLTAKTLSETVSLLTNFYLDAYEASPIYCENSNEQVNIRIKRLFKNDLRFKIFQRKWYPVALRFRRMI